MSDATQLMYTYRECARTIWNCYLRSAGGRSADFDTVDTFSRVSDLLFYELVLFPLGVPGYEKESSDDAYPFLQVKPITDPVPIMIRRPTPQGRYWDEPIKLLKLSGLSLLFVDYYDWDVLGYIELQYYRVKIAQCDEYPYIVGREALLEVHHADIEFLGVPKSSSKTADAEGCRCAQKPNRGRPTREGSGSTPTVDT